MKLNKQQREEVRKRYDGHCAYCGLVLGDSWHVDHKKPIRRNTSDYDASLHCMDNLMPACKPCNYNKGSLTLENWRKQLTHYRDIQVIRDCPQVRHLLRFSQITFEKSPIVFYFESLGDV